MINIVNRFSRQWRLITTTLLSALAVTTLLLTTPFAGANSGEDQPQQDGLAGTWISIAQDAPNISSFMSDGRVIASIPLDILTGNGPGGTSELAAPSQGEWKRTGNRTFVSTSYSLLSSPLVGFTHRVKLANIWTLNKAGDELTLTDSMVTVFLPDGTPQFPPFSGSIVHFKRVIAGQ